MIDLLDRFRQIEQTFSQQKGDFALFALFLREDAVDKWDLILAAPWIEADRKVALTEITNAIQTSFAPDELSQLSRIVLVDLTNPAVEALNRSIRVQHGQAEVLNSNFFGLPIKHAYVISSQKIDVNEEVPA